MAGLPWEFGVLLLLEFPAFPKDFDLTCVWISYFLMLIALLPLEIQIFLKSSFFLLPPFLKKDLGEISVGTLRRVST